jgi:hypothetical protein
MGDNFLRQQINNFKKRRDQAVANRKRPTLFDRPELVSTQYPVTPAPDRQLEKGEILFGVASNNGTLIDVARGHVKVGCMEGDAAHVLRNALREPGQLGVIKLQIVDVKPLSGVAQARIVVEEGGT